jgi:tRNA A37 threonylcarbamoyladenosine dehydratase
MAAALLRRRHSDRGNVTRMSHDLARYHRQILLPGFGEEGQRRLLDSTALLLGCGALGSVAADMLARAGVGHLVIVDRDFIELTNLQRQVLFDESDVTGAIPKAEAAKRKIARINSQVQVTAIVDDVNHTNIERFADGVDVIVDGLDNFEATSMALRSAQLAWRSRSYRTARATQSGRQPKAATWRHRVCAACSRKHQRREPALPATRSA